MKPSKSIWSNRLTTLRAAWREKSERRRNNDRIMRMARTVLRTAPAAQGAPVVFFNASTRLEGMSLNAGFSMLTGWSLRLQGVPVVHFVCQAGMSRCILGTSRAEPGKLPPCEGCVRQSLAVYTDAQTIPFVFRRDSQMVQTLQTLTLAEMVRFERNGIPLGKLALPSLRWVLRLHTLNDDVDTRLLFREYILSAWNVAQQFEQTLDAVKPRAVVVFNGMTFPEAVARFVTMRRSIPVITHEVGLQPFTGFFTTGEATAYPLPIPDDFELSTRQAARLDAYLDQRFKGNFSMAGVRFWSGMEGLSADMLEKIGQFRQVVPVFTNVIFDTSQGHANTIFTDMFAWLDAVLDVIRAHPETLFVIRAHPDETRPGKESRESVAGWVEARRVTDLPNVVFVESRQALSSYELIQKSKFVMIYNSTIGLEASILGAPVLCAGKSRFTQLPTVFFPADRSEYSRLVEEFLTAERIDVPAEFSHNARRFLYVQLFQSSLPFGEFLEEDGVWKGFVRLKSFDVQALLPDRSSAMRAISDGLLRGGNFLLQDGE